MVEADKIQTLSGAYAELVKSTAAYNHADVMVHASAILDAEPDGEKTGGARRAKLVSLIKKREFDEALTFLNSHESTRKACQVEAAYIMHRKDQNKQALAQLNKVP